MGKVDELRKMREAKYEAMRQRSDRSLLERPDLQQSLAEMRRGEGRVEIPRAARDIDNHKEAPYVCGHKGVGGKSCTRPKDHTEKNHRYK